MLWTEGGFLAPSSRVCRYRAFEVVVVVDAAPARVSATVFDDAAAAVTAWAAVDTACVVVCAPLPIRPAKGGILNGSFTSAEIASPVPTLSNGDEAITAF